MKRLALLLVFVASTAHADDRRYHALDASDMDALSRVLRKHVAFLSVTPKREGPLSPEPRSAYGAVIGPRRLVALAHLVKGADRVTVQGPQGKLTAKLALLDLERRVALLDTDAPLAKIGLVPAKPSTAAWKVDMELFALISTEGEAGVLHTVVTQTGELAEYEGHPRVDVVLNAGMPVFDDRAHLAGYSRVLAWDHDRHMIVPFAKVRAAQTSTTTRAPPPQRDKKPWWAR